ncbi:P-loop containing nucleoside triphosphate hydrolase protein, partial [Jimgerdemannia flammicorona]
ELRVVNPDADEATIAQEPDSIAGFKFYLSFFELLGSNASDLLNERAVVHILEDRFGNVQYQGIHEEPITSADKFLHLIRRAASLRRTEPTFKNETSSRSHAICHLRSVNLRLPQAEDGHLFIIDLAGSENNADSLHHDKARLAETREINKSLMTLKDCIRNRALATIQHKRHVHIPYRTSKLTTILKDAFELESARQCRAIVIAHVSPNIMDSAHSANTLRYAGPIKVATPTEPLPVDPDNPVTWSHEQIHNWIRQTSKLVPPEVLCPTETGVQLCRLTEAEFLMRCMSCKGMTEKRAKAFYLKLWELIVDARVKHRKVKAAPKKTKAQEEAIGNNMFLGNMKQDRMDQEMMTPEQLKKEREEMSEKYRKMDTMMREQRAKRERVEEERRKRVAEEEELRQTQEEIAAEV